MRNGEIKPRFLGSTETRSKWSELLIKSTENSVSAGLRIVDGGRPNLQQGDDGLRLEQGC